MAPGAIAEAIMFMLLFAALVIVGAYALAYAARCVLIVVQETGTGQDEVVWPNEPVQDWLGHAVLFIELLGIWLVPAGLVARILRHTWLPDQGILRVLLLAGPALWLFFPIGLLSSLTASSRWVPLRWAICASLLRIAPAAIGFYLLTAVLLGAAVVPWYYALFGGRGFLLPVAAPVGAAILLIYARLIGRLGWLIQRLPSPRRAAPRSSSDKRPASKDPHRKPSPSGGKKKPKRGDRAQDPWAVPEEERPPAKKKRFPWAEEPPESAKPRPPFAPPLPEEIEGYGFAAEEPTRPDPEPEQPARHPFYTPPEEYEPIRMREAPETPRLADEPTGVFAEQVRQHIAERERAEPTPPTHPFFSGVYTFPWYAHTLPNWLSLSLIGLAVGGIVKGLVFFGQTLFGW